MKARNKFEIIYYQCIDYQYLKSWILKLIKVWLDIMNRCTYIYIILWDQSFSFFVILIILFFIIKKKLLSIILLIKVIQKKNI